jgi:hypothetical protein
MFPHRYFRQTFHLLCGLLLLSVLILALLGEQSGNLEFVAIGMLGVLVGFTHIPLINNIVRHPYILAFAYVCYTVAITLWNVPFPLLVVGVILSLAAIYSLGLSVGEGGVAEREVIFLGKYSLFGYISQIVVLQILSACLHHLKLQIPLPLTLSFIAAFALTIASVEVVDRARSKSASIDKTYRAVFA